MKSRRFVLRAVAILFALASVTVFEIAPREADARPGGGQTFGGSPSGGSSRSSGSGSSGSRSSGSGSRSSDSSWSGGSSRSSSSDRDNSWSERPSYSSPWSDPTPSPKTAPPQSRNPHGGGYSLPRPNTRPRGSMLEFFFWIIAGIAVLAAIGRIFALVVDRRIQGWVEDGRREDWEWQSGIEDHIPGLAQSRRDDLSDEGEQRYLSLRSALDDLKAKDPDFSFVVFEDFMYALYTALHRARGEHTVELFTPYLAPLAKEWLLAREVDRIDNIIVGAMRVDAVQVDEAQRRVIADVVFTANYTASSGGLDQSYYAEERWRVSRAADVLSRPPEKARIIGCPSCGAALDAAIAGKCKYCSERVIDADRDWRVDSIEQLAQEERGPMLTGTTEEVGTDAPTIVAPDANKNLHALMRAGGFTWSQLIERVGLVFSTFHSAWSSQDLKPVRPFLSDALFDTQRYWVETYKAQGLRNVTGSPRISNIELSRVTSDAHFDAITVRVAAFCNDFTLDAAGQVVAGSKSDLRFYSEYWTLIRAARSRRPSQADSACPSCGAPADKLNMAGVCEACGSKITLGQFDWVLSRIEQDEVYRL